MTDVDEFMDAIVDSVIAICILDTRMVTIIIVVDVVIGVHMTKRNVYFWKFHGHYIVQPSEHIPALEEVME